MRTIWKFPLEVEDEQTVEMPIGATILSVQAQNEQPCLWAIVDSTRPTEQHRISTRGTGHHTTHAETSQNYIGTYQLQGGAFVGHVFDTT